MKCLACQMELEQGVAKCSACGFPVIGSVAGSKEEQQNIKQMAQEYRKNRLKGIRIGIMAYGYAMDGDELKLDRTEEVMFASAEEMGVGQTVWCGQDFARVDGDERVCVRVILKRGTGENRVHDLNMALPAISGFCHIGITLREGLQGQILMGDEGCHERSALFPLL